MHDNFLGFKFVMFDMYVGNTYYASWLSKNWAQRNYGEIKLTVILIMIPRHVVSSSLSGWLWWQKLHFFQISYTPYPNWPLPPLLRLTPYHNWPRTLTDPCQRCDWPRSLTDPCPQHCDWPEVAPNWPLPPALRLARGGPLQGHHAGPAAAPRCVSYSSKGHQSATAPKCSVALRAVVS